jgi:hypothetical protein
LPLLYLVIHSRPIVEILNSHGLICARPSGENSGDIGRTGHSRETKDCSIIWQKERNQRERMKRKNTIKRVAIFWKLFGAIQQSNRPIMKRKTKGQKVPNESVEKSIPKLKASEELGWKSVFRFYPICQKHMGLFITFGQKRRGFLYHRRSLTY